MQEESLGKPVTWASGYSLRVDVSLCDLSAHSRHLVLLYDLGTSSGFSLESVSRIGSYVSDELWILSLYFSALSDDLNASVVLSLLESLLR